MRFDRGRSRGATGTEYFLVISFLVTSVTAGAVVFTPKFRSGVAALSNDVSVILDNQQIAGIGMNPPATPSGTGDTAADGALSGTGTTSVPDDAGQPPLPRDEKCTTAGPVHVVCTEGTDISSNGSGANDGCWAIILASMTGRTPEEISNLCKDELGFTNDIDRTTTTVSGPGSENSPSLGHRFQAESDYMSRHGFGQCMAALGIPNESIQLGTQDEAIASVDECIPGQAAIFTIDYVGGDPCTDCVGENGHMVEVVSMNENKTCFVHSTVNGQKGEFGTECVPTSQFLASTHRDVAPDGSPLGTKSFVCAGSSTGGA